MRAAPFRPAEGASAATSRSIPFSYLGVDGRLGCLLRVHGQLASVLLLDGPEPPPVVALGAARGREAREGFLGLAHDSRKVSGERNEKSFARDRAKEKKGRAKSERLERGKNAAELLESRGAREEKSFLLSFHHRLQREDVVVVVVSRLRNQTAPSPPSLVRLSAVLSALRSRGARTADSSEAEKEKTPASLIASLLPRRRLSAAPATSDTSGPRSTPCARFPRATPRSCSEARSHRSFRGPQTLASARFGPESGAGKHPRLPRFSFGNLVRRRRN